MRASDRVNILATAVLGGNPSLVCDRNRDEHGRRHQPAGVGILRSSQNKDIDKKALYFVATVVKCNFAIRGDSLARVSVLIR
jgi:hypothetical protein